MDVRRKDSSSSGTARRSSGNASRRSMRANSAPTQRYSPCPNARCAVGWRAFDPGQSTASGSPAHNRRPCHARHPAVADAAGYPAAGRGAFAVERDRFGAGAPVGTETARTAQPTGSPDRTSTPQKSRPRGTADARRYAWLGEFTEANLNPGSGSDLAAAFNGTTYKIMLVANKFQTSRHSLSSSRRTLTWMPSTHT